MPRIGAFDFVNGIYTKRNHSVGGLQTPGIEDPAYINMTAFGRSGVRAMFLYKDGGVDVLWLPSFASPSSSGKPTNLPSSQPAKQTARQRASQPASRPASQPAKQPSSQAGSQPTGQPASQPASQRQPWRPRGLEICVKDNDSTTSKSQYELEI